jgi:thymidylate synthase
VQWNVPDLQRGYTTIARDLLDFGQEVAPRGEPTREVLGATIILEDPRKSLPVGIGRKPNLAIAAAEALQLIGGVSYPELMVRITKNFDQFRDDGTYHGAYGPRVRAQLPRIVDRLATDPDTRQAVLTIWDPVRDCFTDGLRDYPCTIALQYMVRKGKLEAHTFMRSNDIWWGLAYDAFQFCQLQFTVAHALKLPVGRYYHHANSLHVYERDIPKVLELETTVHEDESWRVNGMTTSDINRSMQIARDLLTGLGDPNRASESWYLNQLAPYL